MISSSVISVTAENLSYAIFVLQPKQEKMLMIVNLEIVGLFLNREFDIPDNIDRLDKLLNYLNKTDNSDKGFKLFFHREKLSNKNYSDSIDKISIRWLTDTVTKSGKHREHGLYALADAEPTDENYSAKYPFTVWQYYLEDENGQRKSEANGFIPAFSEKSPAIANGDRLTFRCVVIAASPGEYRLAFRNIDPGPE
jgi:hypothetical protein